MGWQTPLIFAVTICAGIIIALIHVLLCAMLKLTDFPKRPVWLQPRRTWRKAHGQCVCCGYDLRATPNRCPECGNVFGPGTIQTENL